MKQNPKMANVKNHHFILVHGSCHGAWCWYKLVNLLKLSGHRVTALDLGASGVNPKRLDEIASFSEFVQPLIEFMDAIDEEEKVVLVGHSYGGLSISLAMEKFPEKILVAVFVTAYMPNYTSPLATIIQEYFKRIPTESFEDCQFKFDPENMLISAIFGPQYMATTLYQYCQPEDLELAKLLIRPCGFFMEDMKNESMLTEERYGSVRRVYVACEGDEVMKDEFQQWTIENSPPNEVKFIAGCGHMVMLSKPNELSLCFQEIAENHN